jgi:hypothetical protein
MSFIMAASADGSCAAISAAIRTVPAESAATSPSALGKSHSARITSAEQSIKSVASRARRHCSGRFSAPGGGASVADRLPCRATASNTSDQAMFSSGVAHTVKAMRAPGFRLTPNGLHSSRGCPQAAAFPPTEAERRAYPQNGISPEPRWPATSRRSSASVVRCPINMARHKSMVTDGSVRSDPVGPLRAGNAPANEQPAIGGLRYLAKGCLSGKPLDG